MQHGAELNTYAFQPLAASLGIQTFGSVRQILPFNAGWSMYNIYKLYEHLLAIQKTLPKKRSSWLRWSS
jgi:hypothetical protein